MDSMCFLIKSPFRPYNLFGLRQISKNAVINQLKELICFRPKGTSLLVLK